jgi:thiamine monophosphate synthase
MVIVISNPAPLNDEHRIIRQLFDEGLELFHLRKKEYGESRLRSFIENLPKQHLGKIVLHQHYHLYEEYGLKGVHVPATFRGKAPSGTLSVSFHSSEEIEKFEMPFNYGFLGPVFNSISKEGYKSNINPIEIRQFLKQPKARIIALGGIDEDKTEATREMGFSGIALLGAIWQSGCPVEKFKQIRNKWKNQTIVY